ncbi:protein BCCIP homolog isoform X2 [Convolutriloba macropyga]|uniref:protein BCCIP homolog isoform X2 n=1 Tax=Convolutriloba macropyga TaxID=536237 RepID=UPI003F51C6C8
MRQQSSGNAMTFTAGGQGDGGESDSSSSYEDGSRDSDDDGVIYDDDDDDAEDDSDSEIDDDDEDSANEDDVIVPNMDQQVNVEFEAFPPSDTDFQSLVALLGRLFYKSEPQIDLAQLANWIIGHNYVGSVLKTNSAEVDDEDDESESDDVMDEDDTVYGITTVVNLRQTPSGKEEGFKQSIINYINHKCNSPEIQTVLNNSSKTVGLLITERFVNIPPLLAPPMLKCLSKEIESAKQKKMPYNFSHLILVSKSYDVSSQGPNTTDGLPPCLEFINPEDEIFQQYAQCVASFPVPEAEDLVGGSWGPKDKAMPQYRTVCLLPMDKFKAAVTQISQTFTVENMMSLLNAQNSQ